MSLKEFIDKTRFDTGITTDTIVEGIRKINVEEIKESLFNSDSTKAIRNMMETMVKLRMEDKQ